MAYDKCINVINQAAGRDLSDDEMVAMLQSLDARTKYFMAKGMAATESDAAMKAADELAKDIEMSAVIERRNSAMNMLKRIEKVSWVQSNFGNNFAEGIEALLVGVNRAKEGARMSAAAAQKKLTDQYTSGLTSDLEATGHLSLFTSGALDREISRALWAMGKEGEEKALGGMQPEAVAVAKVLHKWQEIARVDANEAGAWIREAKGYIVKQSHDKVRIEQAGKEQWIADARRYFDLDRMSLSGEGIDFILNKLYTDFASGQHLKPLEDEEMAGFKGPSNLAKKISQSREVFFKDADAWFDYNEKYGGGNLREAYVSGLMGRAKATGLMQVLGTNPGSMLDTMVADLKEAAQRKGDVNNLTRLSQFTGESGMGRKYLRAIDGSMDIAVSELGARVSQSARAIETMAKLGGMIFSQLNDIAVFASEMKYQGRSFFSGMSDAITGLGTNLKQEDRRQLLSSLGVAVDNLAGELGAMGSLQEPGSMTKAMRMFMKLNLSQWWVEKFRASAALGFSHYLAQNAGKEFSALSDELRRVLGLYSIGDKEWNAIRASNMTTVDGRAYITPEGIADPEVADKVRTYLTDRTSFAALEPDAKTKAIMLQGLQPGTAEGEFARFMMQFKSFTGAYMQKVMGRELYGRGYEGEAGFKGIIGALRNGNGEMQGLVNVILWSTLAGYASMSLKDMAKGRTPRDPMDIKTWQAAMLQGGGMGIWGDFLFGEANRFGGKFSDLIVGPVPAAASDVVDLYHKAIQGDDVAAQALKKVIDHTPFLNLFYTRMALDYLIIYRMQEAMNPGYLRRMERRVEKENAQTFLLRPSEVVR